MSWSKTRRKRCGLIVTSSHGSGVPFAQPGMHEKTVANNRHHDFLVRASRHRQRSGEFRYQHRPTPAAASSVSGPSAARSRLRVGRRLLVSNGRTLGLAQRLLDATPYEGAYWAAPYYNRGQYFEGRWEGP